MKKLIYSIFALSILTIASCDKDDDKTVTPDPVPTNSALYNGKNYKIDNGIIVDWGSWENHYNNDFILTDGEMDFENDIAVDATVMIYAELWSPGTESFMIGTFTFDASENTAGKRYFDDLVVVFDTNNNGELDENDDQLTAKAGSVTVSGSGTNYMVAVDITLNNNKPLKGSYSGTFERIDDPLEEVHSGRLNANNVKKRILK